MLSYLCCRPTSKFLVHCILGSSVALGGMATPSVALPPPDLGLNAPTQVQALLQTPLTTPQSNANTPSARTLTVPGLWWANQQFGDKMVLNWFTYRRPQDTTSQVRAIVRPELWRRYTYLERYAFLKRFGLTTSAAGYHLLVLDRQSYLLGSYTCEFSAQTKPAPLNPRTSQAVTAAQSIQAPCQVWISPVYGSEFF